MLHSTVREAQARTSSREFSEWLSYDRIEPWDDHKPYELEAGVRATRAQLGLARVAQTVANFLRDPEKQEAFNLEDFVIDLTPAPDPDELERQFIAKAEMMASVFGIGVIEDDR